MPELRIEQPGDDRTVLDWQHVHNEIVPVDALSADEVRERLGRHRLEVVYRDEVLVACTTVRPPAPGTSTATVIIRVLPAARRQGIGEELYGRALEQARTLGGTTIETIVWEANTEGMRFAVAHGFAEVSRFPCEPGESPFIALRLR